MIKLINVLQLSGLTLALTRCLDTKSSATFKALHLAQAEQDAAHRQDASKDDGQKTYSTHYEINTYIHIITNGSLSIADGNILDDTIATQVSSFNHLVRTLLVKALTPCFFCITHQLKCFLKTCQLLLDQAHAHLIRWTSSTRVINRQRFPSG